MALPTIRSIGPLAWGTGALNVPLPAGYHVNDILIMIVGTAWGETTTAAGWSHAPDSPASSAGGGVNVNILWRRATGTEAAVTNDAGDHQIARIIAVAGSVDVGSPWNVTSQGFDGEGVLINIPGDTTTVNDCLCLIASSYQMGMDRDGFTSGWTNAALANITKLFDNSKLVGRGGLIVAVTGEKATAGIIGNTTAYAATAGKWIGWFGAILPGTATGAEVDTDEPFTPETFVGAPTEYVNAGFVISTWEFDSPEPVVGNRDPVPWYLAWQMMDNSAESSNKLLSAIRVTGKLTGASVQIHAASPGEDIDIFDIEDGTNARATIALGDTTEVTRYERKKVKVKNLSIWTPRLSGTWDGVGEKDQLHELIIEGRPQGTQK